jgi:hypothetical protein
VPTNIVAWMAKPLKMLERALRLPSIREVEEEEEER